MGRIVYSVAASLDGFNTDAEGGFDWAFPSQEVIASLTDDLVGTTGILMGRRMYETMSGWETDPSWAEGSPEEARFAREWVRMDKIVFSRTLETVVTERTRIERELTIEAVERAKAQTDGDLGIEGPTLARRGLELGIVDVVELLVCPVIVGGGNPVFPTGLDLPLRLTRERRFDNGMVQLSYERAD